VTDDFERIFDANPQPSFVFDRETLRIVRANPAACALYGWTEQELCALTIKDIRPPEDVPRLANLLRGLKDRPGPFTQESRHLTKSGTVIEVEATIARLTFRARAATLVIVRDISGQQVAERQLRLHVDRSTEGITVTDAVGRLVYMSPGGERLLGLKPGAMLGKHTMQELMHPEDIARRVPIPPGETRVNVVRVRHGDGTWRYIESTATNLTLDPAVRGFMTNFRDVTTRVEAQDRFEHLLSATRAVTFSLTVGGCTNFISANATEVLGWEPSAFTADPEIWHKQIHPDDVHTIDDARRDLETTGAYSADYRFRRPDGAYIWLHAEARMTGAEVIGYLVDITERKHAEDQLRRSEANFRMLAERSPTLMLVHRGGKLVYLNPAAVRALGYDRAEELVGTRMLDLVHPDDQASVTARIAHTASHGGGAPGEARMRRRDGSYIVADGEGLVLDFDGQRSHVVVGHDVTERRELFARIALADRLLSMGTLAAGVAHEINNPLAYVSSNLELLVRELPLLLAGQPSQLAAHEIEEVLADAREGASRVGTIVRELRALSRSEEAPGAVDVAGVLASCIRIAHNEVRHRARVVSDVAPDLPPAHGSASRLGQVFLNLLVNAAQAMPEGRLEANEIRVSARAANGQVIVEVRDNGVGIPRPLLGRIFDPFFTTKPVGLGTGLGLSISHEIVRSLGGTISVDSTLDVGSTFRVSLPVSSGRSVAAEPVAEHAANGVTRILVIDDEQAVGRSIALLLTPEYNVTTLTRAREALTRMSAGERYDVILCDVMMPEMTGIDFYAQLPEDVQRQVLFLTGGAFTPQARDFLDSETRPHLEKPFTEHQLRSAIEALRTP
jgi:PAS domain S-box-containing protein